MGVQWTSIGGMGWLHGLCYIVCYGGVLSVSWVPTYSTDLLLYLVAAQYLGQPSLLLAR